ncbi:hypothetical protein EC973_002900 [Apophysomyces ossiformis]|uniref:IucC family-domain-containing protein n=1 Tax=Apophysomyces ossiformis TaxID=679940 RepID=A0A8H7BMC0_9FUNG|nr:hypothetical protein EC973_002900 [Apophysomyces ossiformis]
MTGPSNPLGNAFYAKFATTSRLIACLISEALVQAYYVPGSENFGICVVLRPRAVEQEGIPKTIHPNDVLAIVALRGLPILSDPRVTVTWNGVKGTRIDLIDIRDMLPHIYTLSPATTTSAQGFPHQEVYAILSNLFQADISLFKSMQLVDGYDAVQIWEKFAQDFGVEEQLRAVLADELQSSIDHQKHTYDHPRSLPTLTSSTIHWEQSILEGHASHPMHKARKSYPPMPPLYPGQYNLDQPKLRAVAIPTTSINLRGDFEELSRPLIDAMLNASDKEGSQTMRSKYPNHVFVPVHELQVPNVEAKFPDAVVLPAEYNVTVEALTSIRSVAAPTILPGLSIKLCLGVKISSALRTVSPYLAYFGPGFSRDVVPKLTYDRTKLTIERELGSAVYNSNDYDIAKHCSCVIREAHEYAEDNQDTIVPCAALVEKIQRPDTDETLLTHVWGLDTKEKRVAFLDRYVETALQAFLPPLLINGVAFEAHGQNTLARFDKQTGELKGFVIRDLGGIKVHPETLKQSCGVDVDAIPNSSVIAETLDESYKLLYHSLIHCHFQRLIRVLDLHYDGTGWAIVKGYMTGMIPKEHALWSVFMENKKFHAKCLVRMKIDELYRDFIYHPLPNLIHYQPQQA